MAYTREEIATRSAPAAIGPYSQAIRAGEMVFTSGQIPLEPASGSIVSGSVERQAEQVMQNLKAVLEAAGSSFERVVKFTCFITDMADFPAVNAVFERHLSSPYPARSCVQVAALPKAAAVEVEAIALAG
ncbi:MAG: RidA family protein [Spirochaetaceae bacterium]|nr:MAG: RidA family protein [Spirochaetaceae bacterium]